MILFRATQRRDTKPLAKALLARFGSFAEVMNAPEALLAELPGIGEAAITELKLVRAAAVRLMLWPPTNELGCCCAKSWGWNRAESCSA